MFGALKVAYYNHTMTNSTTLRQTFTGHSAKGFHQARSASCLRPHPLLVCVLACECYMHLKTQLLCHSNIWQIHSALRVLPKSKKPKKNPCFILSGSLRVNNRRVVSFSRFCSQQWKKWHSFSQTLLLRASACFFSFSEHLCFYTQTFLELLIFSVSSFLQFEVLNARVPAPPRPW